MENEKNNEKGKNIAIGIFIGVIICLVVVFGYNKLTMKNNSNTNTNNTSNNNKNPNNNNDVITLDEIKNRYQINEKGSGQNGTVYESIIDKKTNTTIISNLEEFDQSVLYLLKNKGKIYIYIEGCNVFGESLKSRVYDEKGNIIFDILDKYKFHLIFKDNEKPDYAATNVFEVEGAYYTENGVINKYNLDGTKISNSKKFDDVIQVEQKYSLVYQSNDNSIYVVSNDGNYSQKVTTKNNDGYCMYNFDEKSINVFLSKCPVPDGPLDYYKIDLVNNTVIFQKGD